jgi:prepilin-type N-terminal cleavage/methylation domain-containing protein
MRLWSDQRGFTLMELIIGSAAALLILVAVAGVEMSALRAQRRDNITFSLQAEGTTALERLAQDVRQSSGFTLGSSTNVTVGGASYQLSGGQLQRVAGGVTRVLASNLGGVLFSAEDGGRTLHMTLIYNLTDGAVYLLDSRATVRLGP